MTNIGYVDATGARLRYEVRGTGPALLVMGSPMGAAAFAPLADALAADYTVVTHDPRGIGGSTIADPEQDSTPELRADDLAAILDAIGADSADVFGSSGGAVTGLAMVERFPDRVRTLIAHEPPLLELLSDAPQQRAAVEDIIDTFHREGQFAAWLKFMTSAGFDLGDDAAAGPPPGESSEQDLADGRRFFTHELRGTTRFRPDIARLTAGPARIVVGIGVDSGGLSTFRTSTALAELLGAPPLEFPGDHGGFMAEPAAFADQVRHALSVAEVAR